MIQGLRFVSSIQGKSPGVVGKTCYFSMANKTYLVKHYKSRYWEKPYSILIYPGFSVYGFKDKRIKRLAKAMAQLGFHVFIISLDEVEHLKINANNLEDIVQNILYISSQKKFSKNNKVGILAPSFSAGMVLNACADSRIQDKVSAVCSIGTFANIESSLEFIMKKQDVDDYGRNVLLHNILNLDSPPNLELQTLVKVAIEDNGFKRPIPLSTNLSKSLSNENFTFWEHYSKDEAFRIQFLHDALKQFKELTIWKEKLNVIDNICACKMKLFFLHGKDDNVISANESQQLHQLRRKNNLPSKLFISQILDHGDTSFGFNKIFDVLKMASFFSQYFKTVRQ